MTTITRKCVVVALFGNGMIVDTKFFVNFQFIIKKKIVLKLRLQLPHAKLTLDGFGCLV
jgi:hypothetical protein